MKRSELLFNIFSIPLDILMLFAAAWLSFTTRMSAPTWVGPVRFELVLQDFLLATLAMVPVVLGLFALLGLYNIRGARRMLYQFARIMIGVSLVLFLVMVLFFFDQQLFPSRFIILASWGYSILLVFGGRLVLQIIQYILFRYNIGVHSVVIVNGTNTDSQIIQDSLKNPKWGLKVVADVSYGEAIIGQ